jgi:hypothetical protein
MTSQGYQVRSCDILSFEYYPRRIKNSNDYLELPKLQVHRRLSQHISKDENDKKNGFVRDPR